MRDRHEVDAKRRRLHSGDPARSSDDTKPQWRRPNDERRYPSADRWRAEGWSAGEHPVGRRRPWLRDDQWRRGADRWREPDYDEVAPPLREHVEPRRPLAERYGRGEFSVEGYDERYGSGFGYYRGQSTDDRTRDDYRSDARYGLEDGGYERSYAGRGPRDYQRSDERLREDVCERLGDDSVVDASDISVRVENGEVTLEGSVAFRRMKHRAEDIAAGVPGVNEVHNRLRVRKGVLAEMSQRLTGREDRHDYHGQQVRSSSVASNVPRSN